MSHSQVLLAIDYAPATTHPYQCLVNVLMDGYEVGGKDSSGVTI